MKQKEKNKIKKQCGCTEIVMGKTQYNILKIMRDDMQDRTQNHDNYCFQNIFSSSVPVSVSKIANHSFDIWKILISLSPEADHEHMSLKSFATTP